MTFRENTNATRARRLGFTLVELLVVITIIGILAGLALVALQGVPGAVRNTAVKMELTQIGQALDLYKQERGSYPPDGTSLLTANTDRTAAINRHLNVLFPQRSATLDTPTNDATRLQAMIDAGYVSNLGHTTNDYQLYQIDPTEAYVIFLMGFSPNIELPLTGTGERNPMFEFDQTRLSDPDGDGWWSYKPAYHDSEIVYFNAKSYATSSSGTITGISTVDFSTISGSLASGIARPYATVGPNGSIQWVNDNTFQLMSAGSDADFGNFSASTTPTTAIKLYPAGLQNTSVYANSINYTLEDLDNVANFTEGSTLEADEDLE